jgi:dephospho-CoA kinase
LGRLRVALTGGIGTGKSYCLLRLSELGVPVIDADVLAREVVEPGTPGLSAIVSRFGPSVITGTGVLDRAALARRVFADAAARRDLESIVHPLVYRRIEDWFDVSAGEHVAVADVPLLYETGHERDFHRVVVAACLPAQQVERLLARGLSADQARQRIAAQLPIDEKRRRADYVIDTSGACAGTDRQVIEVWERLLFIARVLPESPPPSRSPA